MSFFRKKYPTLMTHVRSYKRTYVQPPFEEYLMAKRLVFSDAVENTLLFARVQDSNRVLIQVRFCGNTPEKNFQKLICISSFFVLPAEDCNSAFHSLRVIARL